MLEHYCAADKKRLPAFVFNIRVVGFLPSGPIQEIISTETLAVCFSCS